MKRNFFVVQQEINYYSNSTNEDPSSADLLVSPIYPADFKDVEVKNEPLEPDTVSCKHTLQKIEFTLTVIRIVKFLFV